MSNAPAVSVIMPAYNGAALIGETIASVLGQTFADFELIVVDDCSRDDTMAVLRGFDDPRIRIVSSDCNEGPVRTRNRAFALARGRYVAGLDQDDICRPERLARQIAYLDAHPETVLLGTAADLLEDNRIKPMPTPRRTTPTLIRFLLNIANPLVWSSAMIRADAARRLDPFTRPEILFAEDFDLYHRLAPLGAIARLDEPLLLYRCHPGGASRVFTERMTASAAMVLTEAYRPIFGAAAAASAAVATAHFAGRQPVPDKQTLARLAAVLDRLIESFRASQPIDAASAALLAEEVSRLWWRVVATGVSAGSLSRRDALSVRPASALVRRATPHATLLLGQLRGHARSLRDRDRSVARLAGSWTLSGAD